MKLQTISLIALALASMASAQNQPAFGTWGTNRGRPSQRYDRRIDRRYDEAVRLTADMVSDGRAQSLARRYGLDLLNITWEDTGRYKNSAVGPNISDMTIQVDAPIGPPRLMSVFRFPNFSDVTGDIDPQDVTLLVGNQRGRGLQRVSLDEYLADFDRFLTGRDGVQRDAQLLADRDGKVLVSAQACFLPVPQQGKATFNPVLFNYQSTPGNPAVLAIVATRQGTSATVIENNQDGSQSWGQKLFFNNNGQKAKFTGERLSDYDARGGGWNEDPESTANRAGLNMVMVVQVPLRYRERRRVLIPSEPPMPMAQGAMKADSYRSSDVENAVIGHGRDEGPFTELNHLRIERDDRFPVRVTVQFYKATSNGVVSDGDVRAIKDDIDRVYSSASSVSSLVTDGRTGRPTEYVGCKVQPRGWWETFWNRYERSTGERREDAQTRLSRLMGRDFEGRPVTGLYLRDLLRRR